MYSSKKNKIRLLSSVILAFVVTNMAACSNAKTVQPSTKAKPVKYRVDTNKKPKAVGKLSDSWGNKGVESQPVVAPAIKISPKKPVVRRVIKRKAPVRSHVRAQQRRVAPVRHTVKRPIVRRAPVRRAPARRVAQRRYQAPQHKAPASNMRMARLGGDYANNPKTHTFIDKMVTKHGFNRTHLNYLFTNTRLTPFLSRMAYADGHPTHKMNKKPRTGRWTRYRGNFLTPRTINKGIAFARANRVALQRAEDRYGVPKEYILGIIGVETRYGGNVGKNRAIDALAAMGFENARRGRYFQSELEAYLLMTRKERLNPLKPMASYAGALGLCQFMPSNIKRYAVDHDGNGSVNLWTPADAIGSVANYFQKHGWARGGTVAVRADSRNTKYKTLRTGFKSSHSLSRLRSKGVSARNLGNISGKASLIKLNTYDGDELWLGGHNFYVITRYNHSSHYAMAVHQLAQAISSRTSGSAILHQASIQSLLKDL